MLDHLIVPFIGQFFDRMLTSSLQVILFNCLLVDVPFDTIYTWVERGTVRIKSLAPKQTTAMRDCLIFLQFRAGG